MRFNVFRNSPIDPIISHMRIGWEEGIRKQTETYWRGVLEKEYQDRLDAEYWIGYQNGYNYALDSGDEK